MRSPNFSENLWKRFYLIGDDVFEALLFLIESQPQFAGKIFKLNLCRYEDGGQKIIGVKLFEDNQLYALVEISPDHREWELLENGKVECADSVSRLDLVLYMVEEIQANYKDEKFWIDDSTGTERPSTK